MRFSSNKLCSNQNKNKIMIVSGLSGVNAKLACKTISTVWLIYKNDEMRYLQLHRQLSSHHQTVFRILHVS